MIRTVLLCLLRYVWARWCLEGRQGVVMKETPGRRSVGEFERHLGVVGLFDGSLGQNELVPQE